jgi:hypothetical protein
MKAKTEKMTVAQHYQRQLLACWPALKGSLAQVRKPCIRPSCPVCARGDKHPTWLLAYTHWGKRRCRYVPAAMVPVLRRALANGRRLERLLYEMGPRLLQEYRAQNPAQTGPAVKVKRGKPSPKS